jgi:hypothetical protein
MRSPNRLQKYLILAAALLIGLPSISFAGDRDHVGGFFLRLSAGVGGASTKIEDDVDELKLSGEAGDVNIAIGGMVSPNLAVHGTIFGWAITDPDAELNDLEGSLDGDLTLGAIGVGLTYYLMPANIYFSPSIGFGSLSFDADDFEDVESESGIVVDMTIGKEWWVGRNWGLGVAGAVGFHSISDKDIDSNWKGANFAVRFTATMN